MFDDKQDQDPRVGRTILSLQQAAIAILRADGCEALNIKDICQHLNCSRSTFYSHYKKAWEPVLDYLRKDFDELFPNLPAIKLDPTTLLASGKPLSYYFFSHVERNQDIYVQIFKPEGSNLQCAISHYLSGISELLHASLRAVSKKPLHSDLIAEYLSSALMATASWWLRKGTDKTVLEMSYWFSSMAALGLYQTMGLDSFLSED